MEGMNNEKPLFAVTIQVSYHASKKNGWEIQYNRKTKQRYIGANTRTKKAEEILLLFLRQRALDLGIHEPIKGRLRGLFFLGFKPDEFYTSELNENQNMGDCSNLVQIVEDALQKAGIIENDFWIAPLYVDRICTKETCVRIELYRSETPQIQMSFDERK